MGEIGSDDMSASANGTRGRRAAESSDGDRATGAQAIDRALAILDCFTPKTPSVTLTDLITQTGLTTPTAHRIVRALERREFVVRDPHTNRYSIGPAVVELAQIPLQQVSSGDLVATAMPYLQQMRGLTGETAGLHVLVGERRMCVAELVSHEPIRMASGVGTMRSLDRGAAGKVMAAYLLGTPDVELRSDVGMTGRQAADIRRRGYAISVGETVVGASAIAVPVLGPGDALVGAINVTGPEARWTRKRITELAPSIVEQSRLLNAQLGSRRPDGPAQ